MRIKWATLAAIVGFIVASVTVPVSGHHAFSAEFDANKPITLTGTIVKMEWVNPHGWIYFDVKGHEGTESWKIETGSPFRMGPRLCV